MKSEKRVVTATSFCGQLLGNVNNEKLSDAAFREMVRNTLPIVIFDAGENICPECGVRLVDGMCPGTSLQKCSNYGKVVKRS